MELAKTAAVPEEGKAASGRSPLPKTKIFTKQNVICWIIVCIPLLAFLVFNGFTIIFSILSMFGDMEANQLNTLKWNNFANFLRIGEDIGTIWQSIKVTLVLTLAQFTSLLIAIIVAAFLSQDVKGTRFFQTLYFIPYVCSSVAVSIMFAARHRHRLAEQHGKPFHADVGDLHLRHLAGARLRHRHVLFGVQVHQSRPL